MNFSIFHLRLEIFRFVKVDKSVLYFARTHPSPGELQTTPNQEISEKMTANSSHGFQNEIQELIDKAAVIHMLQDVTVQAISKLFGAMYRSELMRGVWNDFDYMHLLYKLGQKIEKVLDLQRLGLPVKEYCLSEEELQVLMQMKLREMKRLEANDSRIWFQAKLQQLREEGTRFTHGVDKMSS